MVLIQFNNGRDWYYANWVARQLVSDLIKELGDEKLAEIVVCGEAIGFIDIAALSAGDASRLLNALKVTIDKTFGGTCLGWKGVRPDDDEGQQMYLGALAELRRAIEVDLCNE